jgi:hypothetical protein
VLIAVLNQSKRFSDDNARAAVGAVAHQLRYDVEPAWQRRAASVIFYPAGATIPPGAERIVFFDTPDQAGVLGWHSEGPDGLPYGRVFVSPVLDNGGSALIGRLTVASVLSHEVLELFCDPSCCLEANTGRHRYAVEVCDPVENDSYPVSYGGVGVGVSNFVLPAWFDPQTPHGSRVDHLGNLKAPFTMDAGGYMIIDDKPVFGEHYPEWRKATKSPASRTARRARRKEG